MDRATLQGLSILLILTVSVIALPRIGFSVDAQISVTPNQLPLFGGENSSIEVNTMNVNNLFNWQVALKYNSSVCNLTGFWIPENNVFGNLPQIIPDPFVGKDSVDGLDFAILGNTLMSGSVNVTLGTLFKANLTGLNRGLTPITIATKSNPVHVGMWDTFYTFLVDPDLTDIPFTQQDGSVTVDWAPRISVLSPENKTYWGSSVPLTFTVDKPVSWMGYDLDDSSNATVSGNVTLVGLNDGPHELMLFANDSAGNMGSSDAVHFSTANGVFENQTIYIRSDGTVDPYTAPIQRDGDLYALTGNVICTLNETRAIAIKIEKDDVVLDGGEFAIHGIEAPYSEGIDMDSRHNITIRNVIIEGFYYGMWLTLSSGNSILENAITGNRDKGIFLTGSSDNNVIVGNHITANGGGLMMFSSNNLVSMNDITGNTECGLNLWSSSNNLISENNITTTGTGTGIVLRWGPINNNTVSKNIIADCWDGIILHEADNNNISENNVTNCVSSGINLFNSNGNSLQNNTVENTGEYGIVVGSSLSNTVHANCVTDIGGIGIHLGLASDTTVSQNTIANNLVGMGLYKSQNTTLLENIMRDNNEGMWLFEWIESAGSIQKTSSQQAKLYGTGDINLYSSGLSNARVVGNKFYNDGLIVSGTTGNEVANNTVNGKPLIYLEKESDVIVRDAGQVILLDCNNITVENLDLSHTVIGVQLWNTNNSRISGNMIADCGQGLCLNWSSNNVLFGNTIDNSRNTGICLYSSPGNKFWHNNFADSSVQSNSLTNIWDNGCEGNYWSSYSGADSDNDGIGDTPYLIDETNIDLYPLMNIYWNLCDINHDLKVDMRDVATSARAFGTSPGDISWNPHADVTGSQGIPDGAVDMRDVSLIARRFGEHYP